MSEKAGPTLCKAAYMQSRGAGREEQIVHSKTVIVYLKTQPHTVHIGRVSSDSHVNVDSRRGNAIIVLRRRGLGLKALVKIIATIRRPRTSRLRRRRLAATATSTSATAPAASYEVPEWIAPAIRAKLPIPDRASWDGWGRECVAVVLLTLRHWRSISSGYYPK